MVRFFSPKEAFQVRVLVGPHMKKSLLPLIILVFACCAAGAIFFDIGTSSGQGNRVSGAFQIRGYEELPGEIAEDLSDEELENFVSSWGEDATEKIKKCATNRNWYETYDIEDCESLWVEEYNLALQRNKFLEGIVTDMKSAEANETPASWRQVADTRAGYTFSYPDTWEKHYYEEIFEGNYVCEGFCVFNFLRASLDFPDKELYNVDVFVASSGELDAEYKQIQNPPEYRDDFESWSDSFSMVPQHVSINDREYVVSLGRGSGEYGTLWVEYPLGNNLSMYLEFQGIDFEQAGAINGRATIVLEEIVQVALSLKELSVMSKFQVEPTKIIDPYYKGSRFYDARVLYFDSTGKRREITDSILSTLDLNNAPDKIPKNNPLISIEKIFDNEQKIVFRASPLHEKDGTPAYRFFMFDAKTETSKWMSINNAMPSFYMWNPLTLVNGRFLVIAPFITPEILSGEGSNDCRTDKRELLVVDLLKDTYEKKISLSDPYTLVKKCKDPADGIYGMESVVQDDLMALSDSTLRVGIYLNDHLSSTVDDTVGTENRFVEYRTFSF